MQTQLFSNEPNFPQGFQYFNDFITVKEENDLLDFISKTPLHTFLFQGYEAKRRVESFGYDYNFDKRTISKSRPIPSFFHPLIDRVANLLQFDAQDFVELLITEYPLGSVINWHRDAPPFKLIAGLSLQSDCKFRLRPYDKAEQDRHSIISFTAAQRSLYIMEGASRSEWEHSIAPVKKVRYSITLRTLN
ncbi:MAG TPA: alpha-ketoglutarate-dependent dioxygenase AlkB [Cytophagaceae bacterium]|jgi:alkylated DNA repair dioxygenase AlkB